jgi:hypothetical protein
MLAGDCTSEWRSYRLKVILAVRRLPHRHGLSAFCVNCRRWADLDLRWLVDCCYGEMRLATFRPRCRVCGERGELQVRPPVPSWGGYHEWHGAQAAYEPPSH